MPNLVKFWDFSTGNQGWTGVTASEGKMHLDYNKTIVSPDLTGLLQGGEIVLVRYSYVCNSDYKHFSFGYKKPDGSNAWLVNPSYFYSSSNYVIAVFQLPSDPSQVTNLVIHTDPYVRGDIYYVAIFREEDPQDALFKQVIFAFQDQDRTYTAPLPSVTQSSNEAFAFGRIINSTLSTRVTQIKRTDGNTANVSLAGYNRTFGQIGGTPSELIHKVKSNASLQQVELQRIFVFNFDPTTHDLLKISKLETYILSNPFNPQTDTATFTADANGNIDTTRTISFDFLAKTLGIFNLIMTPEVTTDLDTTGLTTLRLDITVKDDQGNVIGTTYHDLLNNQSGGPVTIPKDYDEAHLTVDSTLTIQGTLNTPGNVYVNFTLATQLPQ